ncbi:MAG: 4-(cytidine 5'-diphospho)-2-C-methyl-D-erythritol kinase [Bacillota bacterium]
MSKTKSKRMFILARAKLNLTLDILGRRPDGYHELESVVQSIDLYDGVAVGSTAARPIMHDGAEIGVTLDCEHPLVPRGHENLVVRAAIAMARYTRVGASVWIDMKKQIPVAAGLGGGSADAAAVLLGLNEMWGLGLSGAELARIGETVGADVPFCITGGSGVIRGKGERVEPLPALENVWFVVVVPPCTISTAEAYAAFDKMGSTGAGAGAVKGYSHGVARATPAMIEAVAAGDLKRIAAGLANDLEEVATSMVPAIAEAKRALLEAGALGAGMSGSGPAVFGVAENEKAARQIRRALREKYDTTFVCCSTARGLERVELRQRIRYD